MYPDGDTCKADGGGPVRAGGGSGEAYCGAQGDGKRRSKSLSGGAEASDGSEGVGSLFS